MGTTHGHAPTSPVRRVLFNQRYWPFFAGMLASNSGTWFQNIAQVLLVYRLTNSPFWVGVVNFAQFAPILFLAPLGGSAADRFDRRKLVISMQTGATALATCLCLLTAADVATQAIVIAVAIALGVTLALSTPALQAMVPSLVPREDLHAAVALTALTHNVARVIGPVLGVVVISQWGIAAAFAVNALSYFALIAAVTVMKPSQNEKPSSHAGYRFRESFRRVRADPNLYAPLVVVALVSLSTDPVSTLTPAFSTEIFGLADTFTGYLVGAFGIGAVFSTIVMTRWDPTHRMTAITLLVIGAGMVGFSLSPFAHMALVSLFVAGFGYLASVTSATSIMHEHVEESHRGRAMAIWSISFLGTKPIASAIDGALASVISVQATGVIMALPVLAGAIWLMAMFGSRVDDAEAHIDHVET